MKMKKLRIYIDKELLRDYAIAISGAWLHFDALSSNDKIRKAVEEIMSKAGLPVLGEVRKRGLIFSKS